MPWEDFQRRAATDDQKPDVQFRKQITKGWIIDQVHQHQPAVPGKVPELAALADPQPAGPGAGRDFAQPAEPLQVQLRHRQSVGKRPDLAIPDPKPVVLYPRIKGSCKPASGTGRFQAVSPSWAQL